MSKRSKRSKHQNGNARKGSAGRNRDRGEAEQRRPNLDSPAMERDREARARQAAMPLGNLRRGATSVARNLNDAGTVVVESVRSNPVPSMLIGAGVAWLVADRVNRRTRFISRAGASLGEAAGVVGERLYEVRGTLAETAGTVGETLSGAAGTVRRRFAETADLARQGASRVSEYASTGATTAAESARRGYEAGRETVTQTWDRYPLAVGLAALAVGVAAGMLMPGTRAEQEMMGDTAEEMAGRVREATKELVRRGKRAAAAAAEATAAEAARVGLSTEELRQKIKHLANTASMAATSRGVEEE